MLDGSLKWIAAANTTRIASVNYHKMISRLKFHPNQIAPILLYKIGISLSNMPLTGKEKMS